VFSNNVAYNVRWYCGQTYSCGEYTNTSTNDPSLGNGIGILIGTFLF